ncbi:hypothetical protein ACFFX0_20750 [Citricoccus parietis]|uniref:Uncharacterized protein n=1 Tax=Citricoccus parietis TaxID=592307 RepID=A0ABV5G3J1_9MICC
MRSADQGCAGSSGLPWLWPVVPRPQLLGGAADLRIRSRSRWRRASPHGVPQGNGVRPGRERPNPGAHPAAPGVPRRCCHGPSSSSQAT